MDERQELNNFGCENTTFSLCCNFCESCTYCNYCSLCNFSDYCSSCYKCNFCTMCDDCSYCIYSKGLRLSERMIFCLGNEKDRRKSEGYQKNYRIFNKDVSPTEYVKVLHSLSSIQICNRAPEASSYEDAWAMFWDTASQKEKDLILNIPQFDKKIFEGITGIKI